MQVQTSSHRMYRFGPFELDRRRFEFRRGTIPIKLEKIPMELLFLLAERRGELVTRQEIVDRLWGASINVDAENGINTAIRKIRTATADGVKGTGDPIQTVVGKGYRIALDVEVVEDELFPPGRKQGKPSFRWVWLVAALSLLGVAGVIIASRLREASPITSIAVLPLDNFSEDPRQDYFADGITDAIITRVAQSGGFKVISRSSVMRFKGKERDVRKIARELKVDAVVEGSVIREKSRVRVTAQLIDARTDRHLWAEQYDRDTSEILQLQDEVAQRIARSIRASLQPAASGSLQRLDADAYDNYLRDAPSPSSARGSRWLGPSISTSRS